MPTLELKPSHKPVQHYYTALRQFDDLGVSHEGAVRSAFSSLSASNGERAGVRCRSPKHLVFVNSLARVSARLCRLLRDEVAEQLALKSEALTSLAVDWRKLLFPEANDKTFADGYAQAVTFGLSM